MNEYKILLEKYEYKIENFTIADYKKLIGDVKMFWYRNHKSIEYFISHITEDDRVAFLAGADRKSTRLNSSHKTESRMPSSA